MSVLSGRTALVTGASRGIGLAIATQLVARGVRVGLVARNPDNLARAAEASGGHPLPADAGSPEDVEALVGRFDSFAGGCPDVIVNSAGSFLLAPLIETGAEDFDRQIASNLRAPFLIARAFLPRMLERGSGHLINIGSVAGRLPLPGNSAYAAAKFGLRGMHEVLALELRGTGVRATLIEPSATDTPLWDPLDPARYPDLPGRDQMLRPDDVARAVVFAVEQPASVEISTLALRASP